MTRRGLAAVAVAGLAFALYRATLLPGVDFGDTPSFQVMAGSPSISPRDAYPLYFALGDLVVWLRGGDHAHALNLASAIEAAIASGVFVLVAAELSGSIAAGVAAGVLIAGSYTFWSQAIIAEVYALHMLLAGATMLALFGWQKHQSVWRLAAFFAVYAVSFGNHLTMILLLPAYASFLLISAAGGWRSLIRVRVVSLAVLFAMIGALPYIWNFRHLWLMRVPPETFSDGLRTFWFDITKEDWRGTIVMALPRSMWGERLRMYAFDLFQQFGWVAPSLALVGLVWLVRRSPQRSLLVTVAFAVNFAFAFSYSVGDSHVFFLPSHIFVALLAACGAAWLGSTLARATSQRAASYFVPLALLAVAGQRVYDNYPALDRSADRRPSERLEELTRGLDDRRDILLVDLNWQVQNGLTYFAQESTRDVAVRRLADVLLYAPTLVRDNHAIGREVVLSNEANNVLAAAYGPALSTTIDSRAAADTLSTTVSTLRPGTRYVLAILKPTRDIRRFDGADVTRSMATLSGGHTIALPTHDYYAIAGLVGRPPLFVRESDTPFRGDVIVGSVPVTIRMDAWLAFDTIRRMGFGHAIAARQHTLIIERGVSFATFDDHGRPIVRAYAAGIFAPEPRYQITRAMVEP